MIPANGGPDSAGWKNAYRFEQAQIAPRGDGAGYALTLGLLSTYVAPDELVRTAFDTLERADRQPTGVS